MLRGYIFCFSIVFFIYTKQIQNADFDGYIEVAEVIDSLFACPDKCLEELISTKIKKDAYGYCGIYLLGLSYAFFESFM